MHTYGTSGYIDSHLRLCALEIILIRSLKLNYSIKIG